MGPGKRWRHKREEEPSRQKPAQHAGPVGGKREQWGHTIDAENGIEEPIGVVDGVAQKPMDERPQGEVLRDVARTPERVRKEAICEVAGNASHEKRHAHPENSLTEELASRVAAAVLHEICPAQHHEHGNGEDAMFHSWPRAGPKTVSEQCSATTAKHDRTLRTSSK